MKGVFTYLLILVFSVGFSQNVDFKHQPNIASQKIKTIRLADVETPKALLENIAEEYPKPSVNYETVKKMLDQNRKRRFSHSFNKYDKNSEEIEPAVLTDFDGLPVGSSGIPCDNSMAISNAGIVMSAINSSVTILDSTGKLLKFTTLKNIVDGQLPNLDRTYDPKVSYDPIADRFILVFLQGSASKDTRIITGFSETNDPLGIWNFYAIDGNPFLGKTWSDYPIIGQSKEDLFITVNILKDSTSWQEGFQQSVIWQVNKQSGYDGLDSIYQDLWYDLKYNNRSLWSICVVQGGSDFTSPNMHFLTVRPGDAANDTVFIHEITNSQQSNISEYKLKVLQTNKKYGVPPSAFQPNTENLLQTNDARVLSAISESGYIQFVQSTMIPETGVPGLMHSFLNLENGQIESEYITHDTLEFAYPSIAYAGSLENPHASVITFSHTSEFDFCGTSAIFHNRVAGNEALFSPIVVIKQGDIAVDRLTDSLERWGDYTGIQTRYNQPGVVWMSGSYGKKLGTNIRGFNSAWIGAVKVDNQLNTISSSTDLLVYPNPVLQSATFQFMALSAEKMTFDLYDAMGKHVDVLLEQEVKIGINQFTFDTAHLTAGAYFVYVLNSQNKKVFSQKILVL
ncbi:MAG: T9SS type A sorting domain-containing protein [Flavobacteriales bacterium]|nr:T9SS type A sorting domain-containing protein [Flavobacteriales bacterium]